MPVHYASRISLTKRANGSILLINNVFGDAGRGPAGKGTLASHWQKRQFTRYTPVPETLFSGKSPAIKTGLLAITRWVISLGAGFLI
jgi:hypothetical protein